MNAVFVHVTWSPFVSSYISIAVLVHPTDSPNASYELLSGRFILPLINFLRFIEFVFDSMS